MPRLPPACSRTNMSKASDVAISSVPVIRRCGAGCAVLRPRKWHKHSHYDRCQATAPVRTRATPLNMADPAPAHYVNSWIADSEKDPAQCTKKRKKKRPHEEKAATRRLAADLWYAWVPGGHGGHGGARPLSHAYSLPPPRAPARAPRPAGHGAFGRVCGVAGCGGRGLLPAGRGAAGLLAGNPGRAHPP